MSKIEAKAPFSKKKLLERVEEHNLVIFKELLSADESPNALPEEPSVTQVSK